MYTRTRDDTLFDLRYAVRVLERQARLQGHCIALVKFLMLLGGSAALASLVSGHAVAAICLGLVFATVQALDLALEPTAKQARALAARLNYARLLARQAALDDAALEAGYQGLLADDDVVVGRSLQELAYNDVIREQGRDASVCYAERRWVRALS